jgi:hypothetical protein
MQQRMATPAEYRGCLEAEMWKALESVAGRKPKPTRDVRDSLREGWALAMLAGLDDSTQGTVTTIYTMRLTGNIVLFSKKL